MEAVVTHLFQPPPSRNPCDRTGLGLAQNGGQSIADTASGSPVTRWCPPVHFGSRGMGWRERMGLRA